MGGGVGLTWHSPIRIATDSTMYAMPETAIGFFTDVGGSYFLPRIKDGDISLGLYLGLTGQRLKAQDLALYGVATHFVPQANMSALYADLKKNVTADSSNEQIEAIVNIHSLKDAHKGSIANYDEIKHIFQADSVQGIMQRLAASETEFGASTRKMLTKMSPLSLAIVYEQIVRGSKMDVKEVFEMEYRISQGFMNHTEFFEGVRALLVDKDRKPNWKHTSVDQVTKSEVDWFFDFDAQCKLEL